MQPKVFISFKFTGVPQGELEAMLVPVCSTLRGVGLDLYCSLEDEAWFQEQSWTVRQIFQHAFDQADECDFMLVVLRHNEKSEGVIGEVMRGLGKLPILMAVHQDVDQSATHLPKLADGCLEWESVDELCQKLHDAFADPEVIHSLMAKRFGPDPLAWMLPELFRKG